MNTKLENKIKEDSVLVETSGIDEILNEEEYTNAVVNGDILLPMYDWNKMIAQVQWKGNLNTIYVGDNFVCGKGLLRLENHIVLTEILSPGFAQAHLTTKVHAINLIAEYKQYHLFDELNLNEYLIELV